MAPEQPVSSAIFLISSTLGPRPDSSGWPITVPAVDQNAAGAPYQGPDGRLAQAFSTSDVEHNCRNLYSLRPIFRCVEAAPELCSRSTIRVMGCALRDKWEDVQKAGVTVLGVSMDKPEAQKAFKEKYKLPFTLLADSEGVVVKAFGATASVGNALSSQQTSRPTP